MIGILSWGAHKTLLNTLNTYKIFGIDQTDSEKVIFFQEISEADKKIADKFGYEYIGSKKNIGIAQAYKKLVERSTSDLFLFLENDWAALEGPDQIHEASELLRNGTTDVARLRHRRRPGAPLYTLQFRGKELSQPTHLLDCVHWVDDPAAYFRPDIWHENGWFFSYATHANWTNNPTMYRTDWLRRYIVPRIGNRDIEVDLQHWWENQRFVVAQSEGIFTHNRIG